MNTLTRHQQQQQQQQQQQPPPPQQHPQQPQLADVGSEPDRRAREIW
jgi:hypothetical protein